MRRDTQSLFLLIDAPDDPKIGHRCGTTTHAIGYGHRKPGDLYWAREGDRGTTVPRARKCSELVNIEGVNVLRIIPLPSRYEHS